MSQEKSRQEEAYDYVSGNFIKLLEGDDRISYEHKRSVMAFWEDLFAHEGVRNLMVQAFSNFLSEIDLRIDAARKAGMMQIREAFELAVPADAEHPENLAVSKLVLSIIDEQLAVEATPEEPGIKAEDLENMDLSEVGGGDEDDTSPL